VDRGRRASKRHLIVDGQGVPLAVALTAANINDYGQLLPLLDAAGGGADGEGRLVLADRGYDSRAVREGVIARGYQPRIAARNKRGQGKRKYDSLARERSVIERTFAWLSYMRRLTIRWERRDDLYLAFLTLGCAIVCWRRLNSAL
jgi:transposase